MQRELGILTLIATASGCLYAEVGGGVYGGRGVGAGWSVVAGAYLELDRARVSSGAGGSVVRADGERWTGSGAHGKLDVTVKRGGDARMTGYLRGTAAFSATPGGDGDPDDDDHAGWALFLGATVGLRAADPTAGLILDESLGGYLSLGADVVHAGGETLVGPSLRLGAGVNVFQLATTRN